MCMPTELKYNNWRNIRTHLLKCSYIVLYSTHSVLMVYKTNLQPNNSDCKQDIAYNTNPLELILCEWYIARAMTSIF
jgi:hypothetical protein